MALWDIKGKLANLPLFQLFGGKCREGVPIYRHADGRDVAELCDNIQKYREQGITHVRWQTGEIRSKLVFAVALCHDVHERLKPVEAIRFARELEPYDLFFLEDAMPLEEG